jgi:hypothetical protein
VVLVFKNRSGQQAVAQQSVHPTCGILRDLQAFFWLWVFPTSQSESTPAPARVPITAVVKGFPKIDFL